MEEIIQRKIEEKPTETKAIKTYIFALGGLNEVGKNIYCIEHGGSIIIIDAGVKFPENELPGIDYVIPDYQYLIKNSAKIKALFITHGHEDHIGGIPFLLQSVNIPLIYASKLTTGLIKNKLEEANLSHLAHFQEIDSNSQVKIGQLNISFFSTTHSIPDSLGLCIDTPNGRIVETGDFKVDLTPIGQDIELAKIARLGEQGVTLYMADSTNAEVEGSSKSERDVSKSLHEIFKSATGRIIIATFASNVHRIQQIIETSVKYNRKILVFGRSMENAISTGRKLGYIKCPDNYIYDIETAKISAYQNLNEILILCTGSQGEPMAALSRIANNTHKVIRIIPGDTVVFSSNPIPGNLAPVTKVINMLSKQGAEVIVNNALYSVHTSGHAQREELKLMLKLVKPKYFMPVHGEYRMLKLHGDLANMMGIVNKEHTFICDNGDVLVMYKGNVKRGKKIDVGTKYIDGFDINGIDDFVIKDRIKLGNDGLISIVVPIDLKTNTLLKPPSIVSRGFIFLKERGELLIEAERVVYNALSKLLKNKVTLTDIKNEIKRSTLEFVYERTQREPIIIPVILIKHE
ncbi:MAG: ribonuclease J [Erysipelotrichaceae bacterium]|nr:ribonuclease J [Erysipelotrichaceae bacterium]